MKKLKVLLPLILFLFSTTGKAQSGLHLLANTGIGFNTPIKLNEEKLKRSYSAIFDLSTTYQFKIFRKLYTEIGLGGRYIYSSGKLGQISFKAHTLKMQIPLNFVYQISNRWGMATGLMLRNTKEVLDSDTREKYFWRLGLTGEARYSWKKNWDITYGFSYELRNIPEGYFVDDPKMAVLIGLRRKL